MTTPDTTYPLSPRFSRVVPSLSDALRTQVGIVPPDPNVPTDIRQLEHGSFVTERTSGLERLRGFWGSPSPAIITNVVVFYAEGPGFPVFSEKAFDEPEVGYFRQQLTQAALPEKWLREGIRPPTEACRKQALEVCLELFRRFHLIPQRIAASVEEGILLFYRHPFFTRTLAIEVYNDLEIAAVVNEDKQILTSDMIRDLKFDSVLERFNA